MSLIPSFRNLGRDNIRKATIIGSTRILPTRLRVSARKARLGALEVDIARRSSLIIIAHPKSGNTWLKVMLTRLYARRHGIPESDFARYPALADANPAIPSFAATNGWYSYERAVGDLLQPGQQDAELAAKPVVLLARNPLDIAVSWFFQFTKRQSDHKQELINAELSRPVDRRNIGMWEFVRQSEIGLPSLIAFLNYWDAALGSLDRTLLTSYEELRTDPAGVLRKITTLMGDSFSEAEIDDAVEFASFDNLRKLESEGFFRSGGLTLRNANDPESFKVRRAKVGGYRDYFDAQKVAELEALVQRDLSPRLKALFGIDTPRDAATGQ
ncbi:sulfotransferase domain-containing protein [Roseovarius autotrophicus]|uniref:sulfotransferase domain-containing protein n=1 Tax=Roseovarius autotrophicus TaxID=2824121 RepID=UPI0019F8CB00|nr:sulfotransferase domain-containing protein [Roseovarius autotrophicus]MBE0454891.1 sulfotransferase domain-containing protein [Roseovarius sp.]